MASQKTNLKRNSSANPYGSTCNDPLANPRKSRVTKSIPRRANAFDNLDPVLHSVRDRIDRHFNSPVST